MNNTGIILSDEENAIALHHENLSGFIWAATSLSITRVFQSVKLPDHLYGALVERFIMNGGELLQGFKIAMSRVKSENWKATEVNIKSRFLPMIEKYESWYNEHKKETEIFNSHSWYNEHKKETETFNSYNPYELMFLCTKATREEIEKYFSESKNEVVASPKKYISETGLTQREEILVDLFKAKAGLCEDRDPAFYKERDGRWYVNYYTVAYKNAENYKPPTEKEQESVLAYLKDYPEALKIAQSEFR